MIIQGKLRKRLHFFEVIETKNEHQEIVKKLLFMFATRGEPVSNEISKNIASEGENYSKTYSFRTRYKKRIKPEMIIRVDGVDLEIENIDNIDGLNRELIINAVNYIQN